MKERNRSSSDEYVVKYNRRLAITVVSTLTDKKLYIFKETKIRIYLFLAE